MHQTITFMIQIKSIVDCVGCSACAQKCPKHSITMTIDKEGFYYPKIDLATCVDCGLCEKVCPIIQPSPERLPTSAFAAKNLNEQIRIQSSSGGVFNVLAEQTIAEGGVVFGARFNHDWEVVHSFTESFEGLKFFRQSKYVQSNIGTSFKQTELFLKAGRKVLFSGTPCQIAGLKCFLQKEYANLLTVDFICHGVPSPGVWKHYLETELKLSIQSSRFEKDIISTSAQPSIDNIEFREKRSHGWKKYSFVVNGKSTPKTNSNTILLLHRFGENAFMKAFLNDLILRPSCHLCQFKKHQVAADITIADFWGFEHISPNDEDDKGVSLIMCRNTKGQEAFKPNNYWIYPVDFHLLKQYSINRSAPLKLGRNRFIKDAIKGNITQLAQKNRLTVPASRKGIVSFINRNINRFQKYPAIWKHFVRIYFCLK